MLINLGLSVEALTRESISLSKINLYVLQFFFAKQSDGGCQECEEKRMFENEEKQVNICKSQKKNCKETGLF